MKKKLKELLKESNVWDRKFGESLPTLKQTSDRYAAKHGNKVHEAKSGDDLAAMTGYIFDAVNELNNEIKKHPDAKKNSRIKKYINELYKIESSLSNEIQNLD